MANHNEILPCPLCEGQGQLRRSEIVERLTNPEQIEHYLNQTAGELVGGNGGPHEPQTFQKEVHSWNPQLPIFNRSPKE
jgi:hypothetical protein